MIVCGVSIPILRSSIDEIWYIKFLLGPIEDIFAIYFAFTNSIHNVYLILLCFVGVFMKLEKEYVLTPHICRPYEAQL